MRLSRGRKSRLSTAIAVAGAALVVFQTSMPLGLLGATSASATGTSVPGPYFGGLSSTDGYTTTANLAPGSITHVWLIILENKSYNSEFSGVNDDTYLWQTLPSEGVLLQNYHGTGHTSMDNYITLVSGQAPQYDVQSDCSDVNTQFASNAAVTASYTSNGVYDGGLDGIVSGTSASVGGDTQNWAYGQAVSADGPNAPIQNNPSTNGCTYPSQVATLFDQFNLAGTTWKGYAQDLGGAQQIGATSYQANTVPIRDSGVCGSPGNPDEAPANPVSNPTYLSGAEGYPVASPLVNSTASPGGSATTLVDTSQSWTTNAYNGDEVIITSGDGAGEKGTIASNTATTLTLSGSGFSEAPGTSAVVAPDATSHYIIGVIDTSTYTAASLVAGSGTGPDGQAYSANNPEYSDQYVAKHFPFGWFESLTGVGGSGTSALTEPSNGGTNCDANHIANLDSPSDGLVHDLVYNTVPNFSWITPDNCSDGHDSSCKGNNLSGAFGLNSDGTINLNDPIYTPSTSPGANCTPNCSQIPNYDPEATTPRNYTGGTYSADLFLAYYVPLIERSAAFAHGLIDVTFDEGEPSFVYGGNTFNNIPTTGPVGGYNSPTKGTGTTGPSGTGPEDGGPFGTPGNTPSSYPTTPALNPSENLTYGSGTPNPGAYSQFGADSLWADSAGESFYNGPSTAPTNQGSEPTGPNSPLATDPNGYQLYYGPGFNLDIDRPPACTGTTATGKGTGPLANCVAGEVLGDGGTTSASTRTDAVTNSSSTVNDTSIAADDTGRELVTATVNGTSVSVGTTAYDDAFQVLGGALPAGDGVYVGEVTQSGPAFPANSGGSSLLAASFQMIDASGNAVTPAAGTVTSVTLSGECDPGVGPPVAGGTVLPPTCSGNETPDPLFDAIDPTPGGGDTGSVLISPYITPGGTSTVDYNHYSWLRTMEDLFDVSSCTQANAGTSSDDITLTAGTVCGGLDGAGHIGYAAQTNLNDFGSDVFTAPTGNGFQPLSPPDALPEAPLTVGLALAGIVILGGYIVLRRRQAVA
jgi:hypothetical protein